MKIIFLDRDGVINTHPGDGEYVKSLSEFTLLPDVGIALKKLLDAGYLLCIISNQAGVAKGLYSLKELNRITQAMEEALKEYGVTFAGIFYCPHRTEDACECRKPKNGLILKALAHLQRDNDPIDYSLSYLIGDTMRDMETAQNSGLKTILVFTGHEKPHRKPYWTIQPDYTAENLLHAADIILQKHETRFSS